MHPNQIPTDESIDFPQQKLITNMLLDLPYQEIIKRYNPKDLLNKVLSLGVDNDIVLLRDLMVVDFTPDQKSIEFSKQVKDEIIRILANTNNSNITNLEVSLKKINPIFTLPSSFDQADYQKRASKIWNGMQNIKMAVAEEITDQYLGDVNFFLKVPPDRINYYIDEINKISQKLTLEYEKVIKTGRPDKAVLEEAIDLISHCGRTPIFANYLREKQNLGDISDIVLKLERAIKILQTIYAKNISNPTPEQIRLEIQNYLVNDTHL